MRGLQGKMRGQQEKVRGRQGEVRGRQQKVRGRQGGVTPVPSTCDTTKSIPVLSKMMQRLDEMCDNVAAVRAVLPEEVIAVAAEDDVSAFERVALVPRHLIPSGEAVEAQAQHAVNQAVIRFESGVSLENEFRDQRAMLSRAFPWILCLGAVMAVMVT